MARDEHLQILSKGPQPWNTWRIENPGVKVDLGGADLCDADLRGADLSSTYLNHARLNGANLSRASLDGATLFGAKFPHADLTEANLRGADLRSTTFINAQLRGARLDRAKLGGANLRGANFRGADLRYASLPQVDLTGADLNGADLTGVRLIEADLSAALVRGTTLAHANFSRATLSKTVISDVDLSEVARLDTVRHLGPSDLGLNTIFLSHGKIPEAFLRGCGLPESFIAQLPSVIAAIQPVQFYSCFISYSTKDEEFAKRLHSRMLKAGLRVWFAPEDMRGGDHFFEQIDRAIQAHDRLLIVLCENSIASNWVIREIKRALKFSGRENRKKLFPISLTSNEVLREWEWLEHETGIDLAEEVRKYHIPDFSGWKNHDDFEREFSRLYESLKAEA